MIAKILQRYLSLNQAASYLGLSPKTIYVWAEGEKIPAYKVGRLWRFDRVELDAFVRRSPGATKPFCYNYPQSLGSAVDLGRKGA